MARGKQTTEQPIDVRKTSRMHVAREEILKRILSLDLAPGTTFTEGALAEQIGLSKTPVREALLLIGADGLVYPQIGSGYRVSQLTLKGARDLMRHWTLLTTHAAGLAADNGLTSNELSMFSDITAGRVDVQDMDGPYGAEMSFHSVIAYAARNEELARDTDRAQLKLHRLLVLANRAGADVEDSLHQHGDILAAIQRGNPVVARELTEAHGVALEKAVTEALLNSDTLQTVNLG